MTPLLTALAVAAAGYVLLPLFRGPVAPPAGGAASERARLVARREAALRALRDLALDHATGKMNDADYETLRRGQEAAALDVLRRLDALASTAERLP